MLMYHQGTKPVDVHPTKVSEMERKGWTLNAPSGKSKKSSKKDDDLKTVAEKE